MPNVVFDASTLVGALLREGSVPERALLLARSRDVICLSAPVLEEVRAVFARPKFRRYYVPGRASLILEIIMAGATMVEPTVRVEDCRDAKDDKYLELALAAGASVLVASDEDLLTLTPWRGIAVITPGEYVRRVG